MATMKEAVSFKSPIGLITVYAEGDQIVAVKWGTKHAVKHNSTNPVLIEAKQQLTEYFRGERQCFQLPIRPAGTEFQLAVWKALEDIDFGELKSYVDIARKIGKEGAVRAVGNALGKNPLPILVPCHRVVNNGRGLGGFTGGMKIKKFLLKHEGAGA